MSGSEHSDKKQSTALAASLLDRAWTHKKIAIAVSGGPDSLALMHMAAERRNSSPNTAPEITILTVDHGLREEAAKEACFVAAEAEKQGFSAQTLVWTDEKPSEGIQQAAREARYELMVGFCKEREISALLTAHHLDDQAETLLMRLSRGSGVDGLAAMSAMSQRDDIKILRPLLDVPKSDLTQYLADKKQTWVEDPSNENSDFERVRVRKVLQTLEGLGLNAQDLSLSAKRLRRARTALDRATDRFLVAFAKLHPSGYCELDRKAFAHADEEIALRVLIRALEAVGAPEHPPRLAKVEKLYQALTEQTQSVATLSRCCVELSKTKLFIFRELREDQSTVKTLVPGEQHLWDRRYRVKIATELPGQEPVEIRYLHTDGLHIVKHSGSEYAEKIAQMPHRAATALVSLWRNHKPIFVPDLAFDEQNLGEFVDLAFAPEKSFQNKHE